MPLETAAQLSRELESSSRNVKGMQQVYGLCLNYLLRQHMVKADNPHLLHALNFPENSIQAHQGLAWRRQCTCKQTPAPASTMGTAPAFTTVFCLLQVTSCS